MKSSALLARMGLLVALGVVFSYATAIPLFGARLFPAQHAINVVAGALIGPRHGALVALAISGLRIALGTGTLLALPGSLFGVILAGLFFRATGSRLAAMAGEVVGTGLVGALVAWPMAVYLMGNTKAAAAGLTFFLVPFGASSLAGALLGGLALAVLVRVPGMGAPAVRKP